MRESNPEILKKETGVANVLVKYFNLVILAIVLLYFFAGYYFLLQPKYDAVKNKSDITNEDKRVEEQILTEYLKKLKDYQSFYSTISEADKEKLQVILPENEIAENLYAQMESMLINQGVLISSLQVIKEQVQPEKTSQQAGRGGAVVPVKQVYEVGKIKLGVKINGVDYKTLKKILKLFENNLRLMDIEEVGFSYKDQAASLVINTYFLKKNSL